MVDPPDLEVMVDAWVHGWALSRGFAVEPLEDAFHVTVGLADRTNEFVLHQAGGRPRPIRAIADAALREPGRNWVTVVTDQPERAARQLIEAGLSVDGDTEWIMRIDLEDQVTASVPDGYRIEIAPPLTDGTSVPRARAGAMRTAAVRTAAGRTTAVRTVTVLANMGARSMEAGEGIAAPSPTSVAATGQVAVDGMVAVPDRITTVPAYRRRGLGGAMMHALVDEARTMGATVGHLVASVEGERLYRRLGWSPAGRVVIGRTVDRARGGRS